MLPLIETYLLDHWQDIHPHIPVPDKLHFLLSGEKATKNKTALAFCKGRSEPVVVIKIARSDAGLRFLQQEFEALTDAGRKLDTASRKSAPAAIALQTFGGDTALIETAIAGESLESRYNRLKEAAWLRSVRCDMSGVTDLLHSLQAQLSPKNEFIDLEASVERIWQSFCAVYEPTERETRLFEQIRQSDLLNSHKQLAAVWTHGDFWIGNILQAKSGRLGLIDWEQVQPEGLPFWDLFFFITTMTLYSPWGEWSKQPERGLAACFSAGSSVHDSFKQAIHRENEQYRLSDENLNTLFLLFLFDMSTNYHRLYGLKKQQDEMIREFITKDDRVRLL